MTEILIVMLSFQKMRGRIHNLVSNITAQGIRELF